MEPLPPDVTRRGVFDRFWGLAAGAVYASRASCRSWRSSAERRERTEPPWTAGARVSSRPRWYAAKSQTIVAVGGVETVFPEGRTWMSPEADDAARCDSRRQTTLQSSRPARLGAKRQHRLFEDLHARRLPGSDSTANESLELYTAPAISRSSTWWRARVPFPVPRRARCLSSALDGRPRRDI